VALIPATGGVFTVEIVHAGLISTTDQDASASSTTAGEETTRTRLWDRKTEGGFPEVKELKRRVRDIIEPGRDLGHVDRIKGKGGLPTKKHTAIEPNVAEADERKPIAKSPVRNTAKRNADGSICEDCM